MRRERAVLAAVSDRPTGRPAFYFSTSSACRPLAGQAVLGLRPREGAVLRTLLFPCARTPNGFAASIPSDCDWDVGETIDLAGPIGKPFAPPARTARWLLASPEGPADRLLPLLHSGVESGREIALFTAAPPPDLPAAVELNPSLQDAARWADFIALDPPGGVDAAEYLRGRLRAGSPRAFTQVLLSLPIPCGIGACSACAVRTRQGWRLACRDGTVWSSEDLA